MGRAAAAAVRQEGGLPICHEIRDTILLPKQAAKREFRRSILEAWDHCCAYCGNPAGTLDHVVPKHRGGLNSRLNLVAACSPCNRRKGSDEWRAWFRAQAHHCPRREARIEQWLTDTAAPIYDPGKSGIVRLPATEAGKHGTGAAPSAIFHRAVATLPFR